jgi:hypothetical protein
MTISKEQSALIMKLIENYIAESQSNPLDLRQLAATEKVLPLISDWGGVFTISVSGDIIMFPFRVNDEGEFVAFPFADHKEHPRLETDLRLRNNALFGGSRKYPDLEILVEKPKDAKICPYCEGTGKDAYAEKLNTDSIVCYCGGLGWIP